MVIGGAKSGKSAFAVRLALESGKKVVYFATAKPDDPETRERILRHRSKRPPGWTTREFRMDLIAEFSAADRKSAVVIVDCLTMWLSWLLCRQGSRDSRIIDESKRLADAFSGAKADVVLVSNEVGMSVVPANRLARRFTDVQGVANQIMAQAADEVYFTRAGIPARIK